jgi:arginine decarboxylase-like protein
MNNVRFYLLLRLSHLVQVRLEMIALSYREALAELTQSELLDAVYPKPVIALGEVLHPLMQ